MFCSKCGAKVDDEAVVCVQCGCALRQSSVSTSQDDEVNVGLCILSFFIPLFGIIYWPIMSSVAPKKARACGITGIVSGILSLLSYISTIILLLV